MKTVFFHLEPLISCPNSLKKTIQSQLDPISFHLKSMDYIFPSFLFLLQ